jgi:dTDP-4-dehydrorhamnose reductase
MKILVLGGSGMLGHKLVQVLKSRFDVWTTFRGQFLKYQNIEVFDGVQILENFEAERTEAAAKTIREVEPDVIVNAIGVVKQVSSSQNLIKTITINSIFPHQLAEIACHLKARLICISTDCVFNGLRGDYSEDDLTDATDVYGKSKSLGEVNSENCLTLRTSIIGRELFTNLGLTEWLLSNRGKKVKGFCKAIYTGFPTVVLAGIMADIIENHLGLDGIYHISSDKINKFELLNLINHELEINAEIEPYSDFVIDRSLDSTKYRNETGFQPLKWPEMVEIMAEDARFYETLQR